MAREARKAGRYSDESQGGGLIYRPEDRVRENALLGVGVFASLLVWYGWVVQEGVVWWVPVSRLFSFLPSLVATPGPRPKVTKG